MFIIDGKDIDNPQIRDNLILTAHRKCGPFIPKAPITIKAPACLTWLDRVYWQYRAAQVLGQAVYIK
jgi:hypothetical protein